MGNGIKDNINFFSQKTYIDGIKSIRDPFGTKH